MTKMTDHGRSKRKPGKRVDRRSRGARTEPHDARRELLSAAANVFSERGFHHASIDAVAERAGYSKGAVYWHFAGKDDLFLALIEEHVDHPLREMVELLESAPADRDMAPEASRRFAGLIAGQHDWILLDNEYWLRVMRDPKLRQRYAKRRRELRTALGDALARRAETLGAGPLAIEPERIATTFMALIVGLAQQALVDPQAVPDDLLGETILLIYRGLTAPPGNQAP
jgi:AcrR family transcriptional regulator